MNCWHCRVRFATSRLAEENVISVSEAVESHVNKLYMAERDAQIMEGGDSHVEVADV